VPWHLLVGPAVALALYARVIGGDLLSDDFLTGYLLEPDGNSVAWREVFADFWRPWLGIEGSVLYRPLMSLSYGLDLAIGGGAAWPLHLTNVVTHVVSTFCVALLASWLCPATPRRIAVLASLVFATHPASVEAVAWVSGRVSSLETMWSCLTLVMFGWHLRIGCRWVFLGTAGLAMFALATKESAAVIPFTLLAIDLLWPERDWRVDLGAILRRQVLLIPVWMLYAGLRWSALGTLAGPPLPDATATPLALYFGSLATKAGIILVPSSGMLALVVACMLAMLVFWRGSIRRTIVIGLWVGVFLVPAYAIEVTPQLAGSRVLYGGVIALALLLSTLRWHTLLAFSCGAWVLVQALHTVAMTNNWQRQWQECARLRTDLEERLKSSAPRQPIGVVRAPAQQRGVPFLNPNSVFAVAQRPFAKHNHAMIGLGFVADDVPDASSLHLDPSPLHAILNAGGRLLTWTERGFLVTERSRAAPNVVRAEGEARWDFVASPYRIAVIEVVVRGKADRASVSWWGTAAPPRAVECMSGVQDGDVTRFFADMTHDVMYAAASYSGGITRLDVDGVPSERVLELRTHAQPATLVLTRPLTGTALTLSDELGIRAPAAPSPDHECRFVLLGPHAGHAIPAEWGKPVRLPAKIQLDLRRVDRVYRAKKYWYYFEGRPRDGRALMPARSALDWVRIEVKG
jgi:hypothetical protein